MALKSIIASVFCQKYETVVCDRRMQREAMSRFATSTVRECTTVLDHTGAGARQEIAHAAPPPYRFFLSVKL